jgi:hypothetical protein
MSENKAFVVSQDTEVVLDNEKFLLEKGDKIVIDSPTVPIPQSDSPPAK